MSKTLSRNDVIAGTASWCKVDNEVALSTVQKMEEAAALRERQKIFLALLDVIEDEIERTKQWSSPRDPMNGEFLARAYEHSSKADAMLGFLEVQFCGSYGGFYPGQTAAERDTFSERFIFVRNLVREMI